MKLHMSMVRFRPAERIYHHESGTEMASSDSVCSPGPGKYKPAVNRNRCEGRAACVAVCPYQVLTMDTLPPEQRSALSLLGKIKGRVHNWHQVFATNAAACHACGECVKVCPEGAITLVRAG